MNAIAVTVPLNGGCRHDDRPPHRFGS